jgi:hypothetical protein
MPPRQMSPRQMPPGEMPPGLMVGYTPFHMAEKTEKQTLTLPEYRELLDNYREKLLWVREYL